MAELSQAASRGWPTTQSRIPHTFQGFPRVTRRVKTRHHAEHTNGGNAQGLVQQSTASKLANWSLVILLIAGAYIGKPAIDVDSETWFLLTAANAAALVVLLAAFRRTRMSPVVPAGILGVFLIGSLAQLFVLSYNAPNPAFISSQDPTLGFIRAPDIIQGYELITVAFVVFCLIASVLTVIPVRNTRPRISDLVNVGVFGSILKWATVVDIGFTAFQYFQKIGQSALYNPSLPYHLVAITLFYVRNFYPALLVLGVWIYDRGASKLSYLCVVGVGLAAISQAYITTSRGAIINYGLPVLFVWLLTGRFTRFRKVLVLVAIVAYFSLSPVLSNLRSSRVQVATQTINPSSLPSLSLTQLADQQVGHFVIRVGGAGSVFFAVRDESRFSLPGLEHVYRPSGLTSFYTTQVVKIPPNPLIADSQAPTAIGMGLLIGGTLGMIIVLVITLGGLEIIRRWVITRFWVWPVALALLAQGALTFFSEGVPIELYKSFLAIAIIEIVYRMVRRSGQQSDELSATTSLVRDSDSPIHESEGDQSLPTTVLTR